MKIQTIDEVAEALRCHPRTIRRLIDAGKLTAFRVGSDWRVKESDLDNYIESTSNVPKKPKTKAVKKTAKKKTTPKGGPPRKKK